MDRRDFLVASSAAAGVALSKPSILRAEADAVRVIGLTVDHLPQPLGVDNPRPNLSWRMVSSKRNVKQAAYRVLVASSEAALGARHADLWDSDKLLSAKSICIPYRGRQLVSRQRCWWQVQVWTDADAVPIESDVSFWEMGLLSPDDWKSDWLAAENSIMRADRQADPKWIWGSASDQFPRTFRFRYDLPAHARNATLLVASKDQVTGAWIDGKPIPMEPRSPHYIGTASASELVLGSMSAGGHVLTMEIASKPESAVRSATGGMAALLRFEFANGDVLRMPTGSNWRTSLTQAASRSAANYDDRQWEEAKVLPGDSATEWPPTPAMYLRDEFAIEKKISRARLYATALGVYEARINGHRVGDALLTPEPSQYDKRALYRAYDVTDLLRGGRNAIGLVVGDGWYASHLPWGLGRYAWGTPPRRVMAQLELTFADGSRQVVATGGRWRIAPSPITQSDIYDGEFYDARLEQTGWDSAGFDDSRWESAEIAARPSCRLTSQVSPPIRATQTLEPRAITSPKPGTWVVDFGQNFAGWCRIRVKGRRGTRIEMRFAETLQPSGEVDQSNLPPAKQTDTFILRGDRHEEVFEPRFTYHGFRYVQLAGLVRPPTTDSLVGVVIHSDLEITGNFEVEQPLIQQIWRATFWSQRSNFTGIPTDCPQRKERFGWMGDAGIFWDAAAYNMDIAAFSKRQLANASDAQSADGAYSSIAPVPRIAGAPSSSPAPGWADAAVIMTWTAWQRYGDLSVIEENWDGMHRYLRFILTHNPGHLWRNKRSDFGDHYSVDNKSESMPSNTTPHDLIGTAYWAHSADLMAQMADAVGRQEDARSLRHLHEKIREAFMAAFVRSDGRVGNDSQTSYLLALHFGLVPTELRVKAAAHLVADIHRRGKALSTGFLGTQFLADVLTDAGYGQLAYDLILRTDFPSWGHMMAQGATTMWEAWNGRRAGNVDGETAPNSYNTYVLGAIVGYFYRRIAGISPGAPGFERIVIRPVLDARVQRARGDYLSVMGRISTRWEQLSDGRFRLEASIPANASAQIHLPTSSSRRITEGRCDIAECADLRVLHRSAQEVVLEVGSGSYDFVVEGGCSHHWIRLD